MPPRSMSGVEGEGGEGEVGAILLRSLPPPSAAELARLLMEHSTVEPDVEETRTATQPEQPQPAGLSSYRAPPPPSEAELTRLVGTHIKRQAVAQRNTAQAMEGGTEERRAASQPMLSVCPMEERSKRQGVAHQATEGGEETLTAKSYSSPQPTRVSPIECSSSPLAFVNFPGSDVASLATSSTS
jgi:hypothetical protein